MKILSIGERIQFNQLDITSIAFSDLNKVLNIETYDYFIISGGDGAIRRTMKQLLALSLDLPPFIINAIGSFNVIAKMHRTPKLADVLSLLENRKVPKTKKQTIYKLNNEAFLFSAGNMGDLQHIFLSETLRFGLLQNGMLKYILSALFLFPVHLVMTPFMLMSKKRFFIFTPFSFIKKFGSFYGEVKEIKIDLENSYNHIELDGDIVTIEENILTIQPAGNIKIVTR